MCVRVCVCVLGKFIVIMRVRGDEEGDISGGSSDGGGGSSGASIISLVPVYKDRFDI